MKYVTVCLLFVCSLVAVRSQDLFAGTVIITSRPFDNFTVDDPTDILFTINVGNRDRENSGEITGIKVYLTNRDEYEKATKVSDAVHAIVDAARAPVEIPANTDAQKITANRATIWVDDDQCSAYTHICFVIQHADTDTQTEEGSDDDDSCLPLDGVHASPIVSCPVVDDGKDSATVSKPSLLLLSSVFLFVGRFSY